MRKQSGFSLIELIVAMAVLALIMGAMVHLFGSSVTSLQAGSKQEVVYEEARLLMNELKTTLRYADSINPPAIDAQTTSFTYSGTMWNRHMDINDGTNVPYKVMVEWQEAGNGLKQLRVTRINNPESSSKQEKTTLFPNDSANSLFKEDSAFPITSESIKLSDGSVIMYRIALPVQYLLNGQMKTQTLETKVVPNRDEDNESLEEKIYKSYYLIRSIAEKMAAGIILTSSEQIEYNKYKAFSNYDSNITWRISNNDSIRTYLLNEKFNGSWPLKTINGVSLYIQPYCDMNSTPTTSNIFIFGSSSMKDDSVKKNWNTNYIYDMEAKSWYTGSSTIGIANKSWSTVKSEMLSKGWTSVK